jgi:hypothetical protein
VAQLSTLGLHHMKPLGFRKAVAIFGWVVWPIVLLLLVVPYRLSNQIYLETWASYAGKLQARVWFQEGHVHLLELSPDTKTEFTGRKDGQFEIWTWPHYTNSSWMVASDADREFVGAFNQRMRELADEKQKSQK